MKNEDHISIAREIMMLFAADTGLIDEDKEPDRYLWTDAYAACNFLGLYRHLKEEKYRDLALDLIDQVHHVLGRHREDDPRKGWISGLSEEEGGKHPTRGGLRIGKGLPERKKSDPYDPQLEWERDGQYYHYLTKWMHALNRTSLDTGDTKYNRWAMEMVKGIHPQFTYAPPGQDEKRMYWKMSVDLSHPQVTSMGHHDPLDGLITYLQLKLAAELQDSDHFPDISNEISDLEKICLGRQWATNDPLGMGGLLSDTYRLAQLITGGDIDKNDLFSALLRDSQMGLSHYADNNHLNLSAAYRLAFRELGLSIGLHGVEKLDKLIDNNPEEFTDSDQWKMEIDALQEYTSLADAIEKFWLVPANQEAGSWKDHKNINRVMLATSLLPGGFLDIRP